MYKADTSDSSQYRVVWWLLGIFSAALIAGVSAWMKDTNQQVKANTTNIAVIQNDLQYLKASSDRIEKKVDKLGEQP
jgi:cell division protein FtsB